MTDMQMPADGEFEEGIQPWPKPRSRTPIEQHPPVAAVDDALPQPGDAEVGIVARWWTLVLDGHHDWGSVEVSPNRHGVTRHRLVVFPPGIDIVERRLLRAWRAWPTWGAMLWVVSQVVLSGFLTPGAAFAVSTIVYLAGAALLFARVAELRSGVRTLSVVRIAGYADTTSVARFAELKQLVAMLCHADDLRNRGRSSPISHEAAWWQVYDRLGQTSPGALEDRAPQ